MPQMSTDEAPQTQSPTMGARPQVLVEPLGAVQVALVQVLLRALPQGSVGEGGTQAQAPVESKPQLPAEPSTRLQESE